MTIVALLAQPFPAQAHHAAKHAFHRHSSFLPHAHPHRAHAHHAHSHDVRRHLATPLTHKLTARERLWISPADPVFAFVRKHASAKLARPYTLWIHQMAAKHGVPPVLVAGIIEYESHFDTHCQTGRACGLMQVNHGHERPGQDLFDPKTNLDIGCRILRDYHDWAAKHMPPSASAWDVWNRALTAYNFGPIQVVSRGLYRSRYSRKLIRTWRANLPDR
ncbi:MAG: transglycosylase SLT domain-containing protein [Cyanobacteria bacterium REEB65]|nr:transglycosylase SLT domain-containing protein [Cyanobacteria bacterium REEB65]